MIAIKTSSWQQWELAPAPDLFEVIEIIIQPFQTWEPGNTIDIWKKTTIYPLHFDGLRNVEDECRLGFIIAGH